MKKIKVAFVINPVAGGKDKSNVVAAIKKFISPQIDYEFIFWNHANQKQAIRKQVREKAYDIVAAVGGDGTVNQVARAIRYTDSALAIIPVGSGNGLARQLHIPMNTIEAIQLIGKGKFIFIDGCKINSKVFFCTAGTGFDAHIGNQFANSSNRGLITYARITISSLFKYKPQYYTLKMDGQEISTPAFLITFANANQFGNDAFIAPQADIQDGMVDVCVLKPFAFWDVPGIAYKIFTRQIERSYRYSSYKTKQVKIIRSSAGPIHYDGEPKEMETQLEVSVLPAALKVLVPYRFKAKSASHYGPSFRETNLKEKEINHPLLTED